MPRMIPFTARPVGVALCGLLVALATCGGAEAKPDKPSAEPTEPTEPTSESASTVEEKALPPTYGQEVARIVQSLTPQLRACKQKKARRKPAVVVVHFRIVSSGSVEWARAFQSTLKDPKAIACVTGEIEKARFPDPGEEPVLISYPLTL